VANRRRRLEQELQDESVELVNEDLREAVRFETDHRYTEGDLDELEEALLDELFHARYPPVHEGRRPSYGCILTLERDLEVVASGDVALDLVQLLDPMDYEAARELADGVSTFVIRSVTTNEAALARLAPGDERSLYEFAWSSNCWIVQRHPNGNVRLFGRERVTTLSADEWTAKPYAHTRWLELTHGMGGDSKSMMVGQAQLRLCLHLLSPRRIGATLVWMTNDPTSEIEGYLTKRSRPIAAPLNVTDHLHDDAIAAVLASVDGACLVEPNGDIAGIEAFLDNSARSVELGLGDHGTRHTTAARFSYDVAGAIVFVVSADGPVSVFSDGVRLMRLDPDENPYRLHAWTFARELGDDSVINRQVKICSTCDKRVVIEATAPVGAGTGATAVPCPVCNSPLGGAAVGDYRSRVLKPWEDEATATATWGLGAMARLIPEAPA